MTWIQQGWNFLTNNNVTKSYNNLVEGFSFRKEHASVIIIFCLWMEKKYATPENIVAMRRDDYIFAAVLLGLVSADKIISLFTKGNTTTTSSSTSTSDTVKSTTETIEEPPKL